LRKFVVVDPDAARMKINGSFPVNGSDSFLRIAQHILRLHVEIRGDNAVISR
jgi:ferric-dicitrate binding protein FerR (iron transport regulator)